MEKRGYKLRILLNLHFHFPWSTFVCMRNLDARVGGAECEVMESKLGFQFSI